MFEIWGLCESSLFPHVSYKFWLVLCVFSVHFKGKHTQQRQMGALEEQKLCEMIEPYCWKSKI
jgi:hypothetical protein